MTDTHSDEPYPTDLPNLRQQLSRFSCLTTPPQLSPEEQASLRSAILQFNELSDYQTLGICADTLAAGKAAMESYVTALGIPLTLDLPDRDGVVYIKFNTLKGAWYLDSYSGSSRGVLITYHSSDIDEMNGTYGPFPLELFAVGIDPHGT